MNIIQDKILVVADPESKATVSNSLKDISGLELLEADSENKVFDLIYHHFFVLIIIDETLPHIDMNNIGARLLKLPKNHAPPLLIITDAVAPGNLLTDFHALQMDYIAKPFKEPLIRAKIKIFFELFKQKNAVDQSIDELDTAYRKIVDQHERAIKEELRQKEAANLSSIAACQMQSPLKSLRGSVYQLLQRPDLTLKTKSHMAAIKTAAERISQLSKQLFIFPGKTKKILPETGLGVPADQACNILYIEDSNKDFSIFNHLIKGVMNCELTRAETLEQGMGFIAEKKIDLIFIDHLLPDGTGIDLLSRLNRMQSDIPIVFVLDRPNLHKGPEAVSKGAFTYLIKEEISSQALLSIIYSTLRKAKIIQDAGDARNKIVMISRRDALTKLYNRRCFEQDLESEISKAKRYGTPLSILIIDFDRFKTINKTHGYTIGDDLLTTSAALIQSMVRNNDMVCRYGGEEFAVVLPNTALNGARIMAERIRKKMADHPFKRGSITATLTVSIGIAAYVPETDTAFSVLVKKALAALASATDQGGNTVKTFIS